MWNTVKHYIKETDYILSFLAHLAAILSIILVLL